jgi:uncharacterized protein YwgA
LSKEEPMKIGSCVLAAMTALKERQIFAGKTTVQKLIYFALPADTRREFYRPYHYGPYSEAVQGAFSSLLHNDFITRNENGYAMVKGEEHVRSIQGQEIIRRLNTVADFLADKKLVTTRDVSILAKVHILSQGKDIPSESLPEFIRSRGKYFGWNELERESLDDAALDTFILMAGQLEVALAHCPDDFCCCQGHDLRRA